MVKPSGRNGSMGRAARLMQLGAELAGSYLAYQVQRPFLNERTSRGHRDDLRRRQARQIRNGLQELKGPIMKIGQVLSMQTRFLDPNVIEELSALQMHAPPMHPSLMRAQFKSAFGAGPEQVFRSFDPEPFAAASLGQVHWAVTKQGQRVAVKIQYPAMREAIRGDFQALRMAGFAARLTGHLQESVIREVERGILEETDYLKEAQNTDNFRKGLTH
jgi:predicted unusual protein kinase regulating ubiquinone biosynthesis (AarF/ABC1/UbiB family)